MYDIVSIIDDRLQNLIVAATNYMIVPRDEMAISATEYGLWWNLENSVMLNYMIL